MAENKITILVCGGTGCRASQSDQIVKDFKAELEYRGLEDEVNVVATGCFGFCEKGPIVKIVPDNTFYVQVAPIDVKDIVEEHIVKGRPLGRLLYHDPAKRKQVTDTAHIDFYKKQIRIALRNCGFINPESIDEYIGRDGYAALGRVLSEMTPQEAIRIVKDSGLRGRGGGGFPTGLKWEITARENSDQKYVVCNADEGDPGAFMDRSILEGDPHSVIEAMAICGYCIGATKGLVYIRAEYPLAINRLKIALDQAKEYGLL
ncbi:MAG TPA: NAD(P)H-dependent oxidoreductase subunit E, partial [Prolixibacteraceae bacterium]|nr:NAD(P)H-dependent oxidoreductase subunit E [Prolixibacteraceae bacterium]